MTDTLSRSGLASCCFQARVAALGGSVARQTMLPSDRVWGMKFDSSAYGYFFEAVDQSGSIKDGFRLALIMHVPWAWQIIDGSASAFGWVVQLWEGRRVYLQYVVDEKDDCSPKVMHIRALEPREDRPELSDPAIHWFEPRHVNRALQRLRPTLH